MLFLVVLLIVGVAAGCGETGPDEPVGGPEWRTSPRTGIGAATSTETAALAGVEAEQRAGFDRLTIRFDGPLPGYRVGYGSAAGPADGKVLTIMLRHVQGAGTRLLRSSLPAIDQVRRVPSGDDAVRVTVTLSSGARLPFRVGISLGAFYVDVAHPGEGAVR